MTQSLSHRATPAGSLFRALVILMAVSAGITVANIYYNQPILMEIASDFHATESQAGLISMLAQVGYGLGLFFLTPLGDKMNKKKLIISLQLLLFASLLLIRFSTSIWQVWVLSLLIGMFSVSVQVILPMAAGLDPGSRGKTVGTIFTGLLIGILAARVLSGNLAGWFGWRNVFLISAVAVAIVTGLLNLFLPDAPTVFKGNYPQLLASALKQFGRFSLLRRVSYVGILQFGLFCSFWTTLTFHLSGIPFHFQSNVIGLFGLVAIAGALLAPVIGKQSDAGGTSRVRLIAASLLLASAILMMIFSDSVWALVVAVLLLDIGAQGLQVTNVALIYTLDESSHSRINTIYMTLFFTGGALGTLTGILCWNYAGWIGVTTQLITFAVAVLLLLIRDHRSSLQK